MKLRGKIEGIRDYVNFECDSASDAKQEFHKAVDDYLLMCEALGEEPDKEYKGSFNVRISPDLHKKLAMYADKNQISLNRCVESAIAHILWKRKQAR